jgi:hypothetical protein
MKFYKSDEFKQLSDEWNDKLEKNGFEDHEYSNGKLKKPDERTVSFQNRDKICDFFLVLDQLMTFYPEMPAFERKILQLFSQGIFVTQIAKNLKVNRITVRRVIGRYKGLVLAIERMQAMSHFPHTVRPESESVSGVSFGKGSIPDQAA